MKILGFKIRAIVSFLLASIIGMAAFTMGQSKTAGAEMMGGLFLVLFGISILGLAFSGIVSMTSTCLTGRARTLGLSVSGAIYDCGMAYMAGFGNFWIALGLYGPIALRCGWVHYVR